jgi:hypothetical protein
VKVKQAILAQHALQNLQEKRLKHGFYRLYENQNTTFPSSIVIDYACEKNSSFDPARYLKDYLVAVESEKQNLYLGKAFFCAFGKKIFLSYFILEQFKPIEQLFEKP